MPTRNNDLKKKIIKKKFKAGVSDTKLRTSHVKSLD